MGDLTWTSGAGLVFVCEVCRNCGQGIHLVGSVWVHVGHHGSLMNCRGTDGRNLTPLRMAVPAVWTVAE